MQFSWTRQTSHFDRISVFVHVHLSTLCLPLLPIYDDLHWFIILLDVTWSRPLTSSLNRSHCLHHMCFPGFKCTMTAFLLWNVEPLAWSYANVICFYITVPSRPLFVNGHQSSNITENFDKFFTKSKTTLTPLDPEFIKNMDQSGFDGFTYVNDQFEVLLRKDITK